MQPSSGPGLKEQGQGKPSRSQVKGSNHQQPPQGQGQRPASVNETHRPPHGQANDQASKIHASSPPKPSSHAATQGGIAAIFTNGNSSQGHHNPTPVPSGGDWTTKSKPPLIPASYANAAAPPSALPALVNAVPSIVETAKQQQQQSGAGIHPLVSSMFDQHRSRTLERVQSKLDELCKKRSDLDLEMKGLLESMSEEARLQKTMRDKVEGLEKELLAERSKREALEVEVKALTKQRQDEMSNRE